MRKLFTLLVLFCLGLPAFAGTSAVTATITDSDSQTWNNGSFQVTFVPGIGRQASEYNVAGATFTQFFTGQMNGSGVLTVTLTDLSTMSPTGGQWRFTLCPNASSVCSNVVTSAVVGATPNLSTQLSTGLGGPRFATGPSSFGYSDTEISPTPQPGGTYFSVTTGTSRFWNGSAWAAGSGASGTVTNTGGALTANAVVLGAGGNDTKVSTGITTNGASELDVGVNGGTGGVLGANGSTSGKFTIIPPAVTGTGASITAINTSISTPNGGSASIGLFTADGTGGVLLDNSPTRVLLKIGAGFPFSCTSTSCIISGSTVNFGFNTAKGQHFVTQAATNDMAGVCSGTTTTCAVTFTTSYTSTPSCVLTPTTAGVTSFIITSQANTGFTVTYAPSASTNFNYVCVGNPN